MSKSNEEPKRAGNLKMLVYRINQELNPTNLSMIKEDWIAKLTEQYEHAASFLETGVHYEEPLPPIPNLGGFEINSLEYEFAKEAYKDDVKEVKKRNKALLLTRTKIYGAMWANMDLAAREQVRRSPSFNSVNLSKDPLELWKLINSMLIVVGHTDNDEARHAASRSLAMYTQRDLSLGAYYQ
jgi:hypothetical protein